MAGVSDHCTQCPLGRRPCWVVVGSWQSSSQPNFGRSTRGGWRLEYGGEGSLGRITGIAIAFIISNGVPVHRSKVCHRMTMQ